MSLALRDGNEVISWSSEADIQNGMAELAEINGWRTQTELNIPGWGRLDLVLHASDDDDFHTVIEFKRSLTTASGIRKAFQQADGYQRWLSDFKGVTGRVWLSAHETDHTLANDIAYSYRESVQLVSVGAVMGFVTGSDAIEFRRARARAVHTDAARRYRLSMHAHNEMTTAVKKRSARTRRRSAIPAS